MRFFYIYKAVLPVSSKPDGQTAGGVKIQAMLLQLCLNGAARNGQILNTAERALGYFYKDIRGDRLC